MASDWIFETTDDAFELDVVTRSETLPVLIDFWAEWCAPCRMLGPILEQVVEERAGQLALVKANTEQCPQAATSFQVSSIPVVFLVYQGSVVDSFVGVLDAAQINAWLDQHFERFRLLDAKALESNSPAEAETLYRDILEKHPNEYPAMIGLARVLGATDQTEEAKMWIEKLERRGFLEPEAEKIKAQLEIDSLEIQDPESIRSQVANDPDNLDLLLSLAQSLIQAKNFGEALEVCLQIIERDKAGLGEEAKELMLDVFRVWDDEEQIREFRKRLSMLLY